MARHINGASRGRLLRHSLVLVPLVWLFLILACQHHFMELQDITLQLSNAHMEPQVTKSARSNGPFIRPPEFDAALQAFYDNLYVGGLTQAPPKQTGDDFVDVAESPGLGVPVPYSRFSYTTAKREEWEACDQRDADFTPERDRLCQAYLGNLNNIRRIKAMSAILLEGRTIKFKLTYAHNGIEAIVKVSQRHFILEAASEYVAFNVDRALNFSRVPTCVYIPLPLDYMRSAAAFSSFLSRWINDTVFEYSEAKKNFIKCAYPTHTNSEHRPLCAYVTVQLWMRDVHSSLSTFLALPYKYNSAFAAKYFVVGSQFWPPKPERLRAIGELSDRFIYDFIIGNTDRGMNDHNNFAFGGCNAFTECEPPPKEERIKGLAKFAFLDQGSSLYSHKEPKHNAFYGNISNIPVCRFRRRTYEAMRAFRTTKNDTGSLDLVKHVTRRLPPPIFQVLHYSLVWKMQKRLDKLVLLVERCLSRHSPADVFSLPAYWEVAIPQEMEGK
ncbi:hypothetical protein ERJ75_000714100 [Trypanosoma vivax]|nr:hypothetical protein TRVL_00068 [Trypanosoma vivax]KAH8613721.1 hypothetical protein ERJ75_000714100 [Trypanosoma vivax]